MLCVITRRFGAQGEAFHGRPLRFHPYVTVPFQHPTADIPQEHQGRTQIGAARDATFSRLSDPEFPCEARFSWGVGAPEYTLGGDRAFGRG
jgi:hypothetical protein